MVTYVEIPLERELEAAESDEKRNEILRDRFARLHASGGFDLIVHVLRCAEAEALTASYAAATGSKLAEGELKYAAAKLWVVQYIRSELSRASDAGEDTFNSPLSEDFLDWGPLADEEEHEDGKRRSQEE